MNDVPTGLRPPKIATRLVIAIAAVVTVQAIVMFVLEPGQWFKWLAAILFMLFAFGIALYATSRPDRLKSRQYYGSIRAALVGAGVLLATALGVSITDALGWTGSDGALGERRLLVFLPAIVAVAIDLGGMLLEKRAEQDPDDPHRDE